MDQVPILSMSGSGDFFDGRWLVVGNFAFASGNAADDVVAFVGAVENGLRFFHLFCGDYADEADAHVEGAEHLVFCDIAELLEVLEEGRDGPGGAVDDGTHALGDNAGQVFCDATTGDVGHSVYDFSPGEFFDDGEIAAVGAHEGGTGLVLEFVDVLIGAIFSDLEEEFACEGVAVGVETV